MTLFTKAFERLSATVAKGHAMPNLPRVILPHPLNTLPEAEIREIVRQNVGQMLQHLVRNAARPVP